MALNKKIRIFKKATAIVTGGVSVLAEEVASKIYTSGGKARALNIDVSDFMAVEQLVQETVERTGRLDYTFNNAGIGIGGNVNHYGIVPEY